MYVGNLLILAGMAITSNCWTTVLVAVTVTAFVYRAIVAAEENYLRGKFGQAFDDYCAHVPRFLPKLSGIGATFASMDFRWRRLVVKEYGTPTAWILAWCGVVAYNLWRHGELAAHPIVLKSLQVIAVIAVLAWVTARFLKKSRRLVAD
jgi:hypothetical protein